MISLQNIKVENQKTEIFESMYKNGKKKFADIETEN